jgi:hypothetical protein
MNLDGEKSVLNGGDARSIEELNGFRYSPIGVLPEIVKGFFNPFFSRRGDGRGEICASIFYEGDSLLCPGDIVCVCYDEDGPPWNFWTGRDGACYGPPEPGRVCEDWVVGEDDILDILLNWVVRRIECSDCCSPDNVIGEEGECVSVSSTCRRIPECG